MAWQLIPNPSDLKEINDWSVDLRFTREIKLNNKVFLCYVKGRGTQYLIQVFEVTCVGAGSDDEADSALWICPSARHETSGGVVQNGRHLHFDISALVQRFLQQTNDILKEEFKKIILYSTKVWRMLLVSQLRST